MEQESSIRISPFQSLNGSLDPRLSFVWLPPIGDGTPAPSTFDNSLQGYITVTIENLTTGVTLDQLEILANSESNYRVNWRARNVQPGDQVQFLVEVNEVTRNGVELSPIELDPVVVTVAPNTFLNNQNVPIRFRIDNDPVIRARQLNIQGDTATQIAEQLNAEFF